MVKMMLTVTLLYAISQLPRHVVYLYGTFVNWCRAGFGLTWHLVILISSSASCYNPFVYAWMNPTYRIGFITALGRLCPSELQRRYQIRTVAKSRMHKLYTADDIIGNGNSIGGPDGETNLDTYVVGDRGQEGCAHGQKHSTGYDLQVTLINRDTIDEVELASETEKAASPVVNKVK
ncbi:unnamed protein product [Protopolystoma xenopodis]|uniref:G-protein coupled receptors family 1 profile domain-containing protein n=1 Tax=Protopolystoma xenopodis TaxID=117903 RepID=A0A448WA12_9PLAT|nr:unnamed protein product [Protopolystoma xenopodis]